MKYLPRLNRLNLIALILVILSLGTFAYILFKGNNISRAGSASYIQIGKISTPEGLVSVKACVVGTGSSYYTLNIVYRAVGFIVNTGATDMKAFVVLPSGSKYIHNDWSTNYNALGDIYSQITPFEIAVPSDKEITFGLESSNLSYLTNSSYLSFPDKTNPDKSKRLNFDNLVKCDTGESVKLPVDTKPPAVVPKFIEYTLNDSSSPTYLGFVGNNRIVYLNQSVQGGIPLPNSLGILDIPSHNIAESNPFMINYPYIYSDSDGNHLILGLEAEPNLFGHGLQEYIQCDNIDKLNTLFLTSNASSTNVKNFDLLNYQDKLNCFVPDGFNMNSTIATARYDFRNIMIKKFGDNFIINSKYPVLYASTPNNRLVVCYTKTNSQICEPIGVTVSRTAVGYQFDDFIIGNDKGNTTDTGFQVIYAVDHSKIKELDSNFAVVNTFDLGYPENKNTCNLKIDSLKLNGFYSQVQYLLQDTKDNNNIYFTDNCGQIGMIDPANPHQKPVFYNVPDFKGIASQPEGITEDKDGNIWFTNMTGGTLGELNITTKKITQRSVVFDYNATGVNATTSSNPMPFYLVKGPDNNIWFTNFNSYSSSNTANASIGEYIP